MKRTKQILMGLLIAVAMMAPRLTLAAGPAPVALGETAHFTILAGAAVTSTGGGMIIGDVGASPIAGSAIGIPPAQVIGTIYKVDASGPLGANVVVDATLLTTAKGDLTIAYNDAAGRTPVPTGPFLNPNGGNIGGLNLGPGLYKFTTTAYITGSNVTLTGGPDDVWIFQCKYDLQVGSGIHVVLAGGAQARNIFWQVGSSAVLDTFSVFKGTIMAEEAITMKTSSTIEGRALAFTAGVTFNGTGGSLPSAMLTVYASPTNGGSVTGGGSFLVGSTHPISATASNNWVFFGWNDGNTNNLRNVVVVGNSTYTAYFINTNLPPATLTVYASPTNGGAVTGGGTFLIGSPVPISATASNGWRFIQWSDGDTNNLRIVVVLSNSTYTANFTNLHVVVLLQQGDGGPAGVWTLGANYQPIAWDLVTGALGGSWALRGMNQDRILLQQGTGGIIGLWDTTNNVPLFWWQVSGPLAGWIARDVDGNRVLLQAGDGGMVGIWTLNAGNTPATWTQLSTPIPGLIARALAGNRILLQFGTSTPIGYWTLDVGNHVTSFLPYDDVGLTPGWILRDMTQNYILLQYGDGGIGGLWKLDANGNPIAWYPISGPMPGWILRAIEEQ